MQSAATACTLPRPQVNTTHLPLFLPDIQGKPMALPVGREHHSPQQNSPDGAIVRFRLFRNSAGPSGT
jgi:hypothetical protein